MPAQVDQYGRHIDPDTGQPYAPGTDPYAGDYDPQKASILKLQNKAGVFNEQSFGTPMPKTVEQRDAEARGAKMDEFYAGAKAKADAQQLGSQYYGGYPGGAADMANLGLRGMGWAQGESMRDRGATAVEDQELSDREAQSRYGDQAGSLMLAREAAMGQAPSQAAYLMQAGLDRSLANQQAMAGGARGAAGIALAQGNAQSNAAAVQNQAYTQAGAMRADEMAGARGLYGGLAGQQRQQDQNRLGMGNEMSRYNAGANDQYRMGMGQLGLGYYGASQRPYESQFGGDVQMQGYRAGANQNQNQLDWQKAQAAAAERNKWQDRGIAAAGTATMGFANAISKNPNSGMQGSGPPPAPPSGGPTGYGSGTYYQPSATGRGPF